MKKISKATDSDMYRGKYVSVIIQPKIDPQFWLDKEYPTTLLVKGEQVNLKDCPLLSEMYLFHHDPNILYYKKLTNALMLSGFPLWTEVVDAFKSSNYKQKNISRTNKICVWY